VACGLWLVACGLWLVACGLWLVACGLSVDNKKRLYLSKAFSIINTPKAYQ